MALKSNLRTAGLAAMVGGVIAATAAVVPAHAEAKDFPGEVIQPTEGATQINLIGFNDYHGRITRATEFSANVLNIADTFGRDNSIIIGNGDQVGASEFESSIDSDNPTLAELTALGVDSFTSGNHEFDKGQDDTLRIREALGGKLLGANIMKDGKPFLDEYNIIDVNGIRVGIIGATTQSTASGVSPDGIQGITFEDMVDSVNRVADQLTDGDDSNGEADVLVASYHDGGPSSGDYASNASTEVFKKMAEETSPKIAAVFNAHTHQTYNYDVAIDTAQSDGMIADGVQRSVVQAGSYGFYADQVVLTIDPETKQVIGTDSSVISTYNGEDADGNPVPRVTRDQLSEGSQATYDKIDGIEQAALAKAEELGAAKVGVVNDDITRARTYNADGTVANQDNRMDESSLGTVVADSMLMWSQRQGDEYKSDLSIMNPGGLRSDIDGDGELTYKDAQVVMPFGNTLSVVTLTGAQIQQVFEQQWQIDGEGNVPGRPYLALGLSSNVDYTYVGSIAATGDNDPVNGTLKQGDHITGIYINGEPLDPAKTYKLITNSFLAAGGDNFTALADDTTSIDSGNVDLEAFIDNVRNGLENSELKPEQHRNGFEVEGYFGDDRSAPSVAAGASKTFTVKALDLLSSGFIANTTVDVTLDGTKIGTGTVTGDTSKGEVTSADVTITLPADAAAGDVTLELTANPSGSVFHLPLTITAAGADQGNGGNGDQPSQSVTPTKDGKTAPTQSVSPTKDGKVPAAPTKDGEPGDGSQLAHTGADSTALFGGIAAGAAVLVAGVALLVARRRAN